MDEPKLPSSAHQLAVRLHNLRLARRNRNAERHKEPLPRKALTPSERKVILKKTANRCHVCGGKVGSKWEADHVLAHSGGGAHDADNYLAAHALCNNYRWDYTAEEFQWVLKIGVWARREIESKSKTGSEIGRRFFAHEIRRQKRRRELPRVAS